MSTIPTHPDFAGILRDEDVFSVENDSSLSNRLNGWFDELMVQSGLGMSPNLLAAVSLCAGLTLGGLLFVLQEEFLTAAFAACFGFALPVVFAVFWRLRRQRTLERQLPEMIDELARAAKTGRSLEHCLALVAADTALPLGDELQRCAHKLKMGLSINDALAELPLRTGVFATSILSTSLAVHSQTGGDLVRVLSRLARTLRDRLQFQGRLRAATSASQATAILMIVLPPAILAFFVFRDPTYLPRLFASTWGFRLTVAAVMLEVFGVMWVLRVLQKSRQG